MNVSEYFDCLGRPVTDKVTGRAGIATSVSFDLYGCVMIVVTPRVDDKGEKAESVWLDYKRLTIDTSVVRVMQPPTFDFSAPNVVSPGKERGPAEKPAFSSLPRL
jgi:hypothetical protein